jgi:hypothetical protein
VKFWRENIDLRGDSDGDGDVAVDDDEDSSPHDKGAPVAMTVLISPRRRPSSRICPLLEKKRIFVSATA